MPKNPPYVLDTRLKWVPIFQSHFSDTWWRGHSCHREWLEVCCNGARPPLSHHVHSLYHNRHHRCPPLGAAHHCDLNWTEVQRASSDRPEQTRLPLWPKLNGLSISVEISKGRNRRFCMKFITTKYIWCQFHIQCIFRVSLTPSYTMSREARQRETKRDRKFLLSDPFSIEIVILQMDIFMVSQVMLMVSF